MPPKRKRADDTVPTTRTTRTSTRSKTITSRVAALSPQNLPALSKDSDDDMEHPPKKTRKATIKGAKVTVAKGRTKNHDSHTRLKRQDKKPGTSSKTNSQPGLEPYSAGQASNLFQQYADKDDRNVIGPEGFERLCTDAEIPMDGVAPLLLAWQLGSTELAKIKGTEWVKGMEELRISSLLPLARALRELEDVLFLDQAPLKPIGVKTSEDEPYNRSRYSRYAKDPVKAYDELYQFSFMLAKSETSRSIDMETGTALWAALVVPKYPIMTDILQFITEKGSYKGINKDLWTMTLEFCKTVSPSLDGYDLDGAWPTMLDEFVNWKKKIDNANV